MNDEELHALGKEYEERVKARTAESHEDRLAHTLAAKHWANAHEHAKLANARDKRDPDAAA